MRLATRDVIATLLVAFAGVLYVLWLADTAPFGLDSVRTVGLVILGLGFAASVSAVVPGFGELLRGNRIYLGVTSAMGIVALVAGVRVLLTSSELGLGVLMGTMVVLWLVATFHHGPLAGTSPRGRVTGPPRHA